MILKNKNKIWLVELPQICLVLFLILQIISMICYPGGTFFNADTEGYSFTRNFLSDLGRYESFSGRKNFLSCQFFNMSIIMSGCIFVMFYYKSTILFVSCNKYLVKFGSFCGILGGMFLVMVGITPSDMFFSLHVIAAKWLFRCFFLAAISHAFLIYFSGLFKNKYALGYVVFSFLILFYILFSEFGPNPKENVISLTVQVISQKIILFVMIVSVFIQTKGINSLSIQES